MVVDHEITHITLSKRTRWDALPRAAIDAVAGPRGAPYGSQFDFLPSMVTLLAQLHRLEQKVHEAVAWVSIEVQAKAGRTRPRPRPTGPWWSIWAS